MHLRWAKHITDKHLPLLEIAYDREVWRPQYTPISYPASDVRIWREPIIPLFDADDVVLQYVEIGAWEKERAKRKGWGLRPKIGDGIRRPIWERWKV